MNCKNCGATLIENDMFCKSCGAPVNQESTQQSQMGYQQPANQYYGNPMNYNQPTKKNSSSKFALFFVGGIVVLTVIVAILMAKNLMADVDSGTNSFSNSFDESSSSGVSKSGGSKSSYKVKFKGFSFNIPDNLVYEEDSGFLMIGDEEGTWMAQIEIEEGSFAQIKANKSQLQKLMQQGGYISSAAKEKTLGGVEFITMELSADGQKAIAALTRANSMYFVGITAMNIDNEFDYSLLETIAPIISSASYSGVTSNMKIDTKLDMSKISEIAK